MDPGPLDLVLPQSADLYRVFVWKRRPSPRATPVPLDLTGYRFRSQFVVHGSPILTFDSAADPVEGQPRLTAGADGVIALQAEGPLARHGEGDWSLEFTDPDGRDDVLLQGRLLVTKQITARSSA